MANFADIMRYLERIQVLDILLPFILVFTIVFAVLQKTKILGTDSDKNPRKNFNVIIALVMGLAIVIPHATNAYPPAKDPVNIINGVLPDISLVIIAIIMLLLLVGAWGKEVDIGKSNIGGWVVIASIVVIIFIFGSQAQWFELPGWLQFINNPETQATVIIVLVFGLIIWFITKPDKKKDDKGGLLKSFQDVLKGKDND